MKNVVDYLTWEHVELGVRITGCDKSFEGALEVPVLILSLIHISEPTRPY